MSEKSRQGPHASYNFVVTVPGPGDHGHEVRGAFSEVSGLDAEITPVEYREGSDENMVRKVLGKKRYINITLKRGVSTDQGFLNWILKAKSGRIQRADGFIELLDDRGKVMTRWKFSNAWVRKVSGPSLNASSNEVAIETLEISHEGLEIDNQE